MKENVKPVNVKIGKKEGQEYRGWNMEVRGKTALPLSEEIYCG